MKYVSIDIETTGLDTENYQVLSIGAVIEDTNNVLPIGDLPVFHGAIMHRAVTGDLYALNLNKDLIETIVHYQTAQDQDEKNDLVQMTGMQFYEKDDIVKAFYDFLIKNGFEPDGEKLHITVAGKNFATFDLKFLERLPRWKQYIKVRQRIMDPTVLFTDWANDESLPNLYTCKERSGQFDDNTVTHDAVDDAMDVIKLFRTQYY